MKLVLIEWMDSHTGRGWQSLQEITNANNTITCRSVGWLVSENKTCKVIVPHISGEKDGVVPYGCGDISIPASSITKFEVLRKN